MCRIVEGTLRIWALPRRRCMWFLKKSLLGLALVVGTVCSSFAGEPTYSIDVYPFTFGTMDTTTQLEHWNRLMKYKLFATGVGGEGITFLGQDIKITDSVGYVGSATGNFVMGGNSNHAIGGPLMFGGSFSNETGYDSILTGPTRFNGGFNTNNNNANKNYFAGKSCAQSYNGYTQTGVTNAGGSINGDFCSNTDEVYAVDVDLDVPVLRDTSVTWNNAINGNGGVRYIHVPPACDGVTYTAPNCVGDTGTAYNYFVQSISFSNNSKLHVVMPPNGRLTKVYVQGSITGIGSSAGTNIQVVYAKGATWNGSAWVGFTDTPLANSDYAGNLLVYTPNDLDMGAADKYMQGTYISGGVIKFAQNTHFAGQLLAKVIRINAFFKAQDFKYVPFNAPQIEVDMAVNQEISESDHTNPLYQDNAGNYTGTVLDIKLTKTPTTDVTFDYCFAFNGTAPTLASINDVCTTSANASSVAGCNGGYLSIPICGVDTLSARIVHGTTVTETPIKIWVNDDGDIENRQEFFTLRIFNLAGGVFSDNSRSWPVSMQILDNDNGAACDVESQDNSVTIPEDTPIILANGAFPARCSSDGLGLAHNVIISDLSGLSGKGTLTYQGVAVTEGQSIPSNNLTSLKYTPAQNQFGSPFATIGFKINNPAAGETITTVGPYTLTINVEPVNDAPTATGCNKTLNEGVNKNTAVCTVSASDVDDAATDLTYEIIYGNVEDENGAKPFVITSTGAVKVNGKLDYERISYYPLLVQVTDPHGASVIVNVNVTIKDVNEAPVAVDCSGEVEENSLLNTYTGCRIKASDPEGKALTYAITDGAGKEKFTINDAGNIFTAAAIDYEAASSYVLTVTVTDPAGNTATATASITVIDVDEAPAAPRDTCWIAENTTSPFMDKNGNTKTCSVKGTDPEGETLAYKITEGNEGATFAVSSDGKITAKSKPDFESHSEYTLVIEVSDQANPLKNTVKTLALIKVINENEAPTVQGHDCEIAENSGINLVTGCWVQASDQDGDNLTYTITDATQNGMNYFRLDDNHNIVVKDVIDYDTMSPKYFEITVTVSDGKGGTNSAVVKVTITPEDESPVVTRDTCWIKENTKAFLDKNGSSKQCKIVGTDPDGGSITYTIADGNTNSTFAIGKTGIISASKAPDYEATQDFILVVDVSDGVNVTKTIAMIHVINVNERPTATVENARIDENSPKNTYVTWVNASDIEDKYKLTYKIVGGNTNDVFTIISSGLGNNNDGEIRVAKDAIDYETLPAGAKYYNLKILVCDMATPGVYPKDSLCVTTTVRIDVNDGNEKPSITGFPDKVIDEHTPTGTVVGTVAGEDPENKTLTYSFAGGNNGQAFSIDPSTGVITVARDIDYELLADTVFKIKVVVTDDGGLKAETFVNIAIRDINEGPEIEDAIMTVAENQPKGTTVDTLKHYDQDKKTENRQNTYEIIGGDKDLFTIDSRTGVIKTNAVFDYESKTSYSVEVRIYDQDGNEDVATVTINIADVKETSNIEITYAETESGAQDWDHPTGTIYTNENTVLLQWKADNKPMPDTLLENLHEGLNVITLTYTDPTKNKGVTETIGIFVSTRTPDVTVTTSNNTPTGANIYTLVETVDASDTSVYVNKKNNDIVVTVKEPVLDETYTDSTCNYTTRTFTVNAELETVSVPATTYDVVNKVVAASPVLNENPTSDVTYSQFNDNLVKVSYTEKVAGVDVTISYLKDKNGNVQKVAVVNANGKVDSVEVMTVSYQINVGGKNVTVSYQADAATGQALKTTTVSGSSNNGSGTNNGSGSANNGGSGSVNNGGSNGGSGSGAGVGNSAPVYAYSLTEGEILYSVTYDYTSKVGGKSTTVQVSYTVNQKGQVTKDKDGNVGYEVSYTYVNEMGNSSTQSVYIIVDLIPPKVMILRPADDAVLHSNMAEVEWCVDLGDGRGCVTQDSLTVEGLQPGKVNEIVRYYRDKAGNEASAMVLVMAKNTKDVDISIEKPVTAITKELVDQYYATREPEKGQTFSVSIYNPQTDKEMETMIGGSFKNKAVHNDSVYPGLPGHLGPTLGIDVKVPMINTVNGLATLDDLIGSDGMVLLDAVDAVGSRKMSVEDYVQEYCTADFRSELGSDFSKANIYDTKMKAKIWIYTSLGQFVDYFSFTQELNDPSYASDAGVLSMYFEMKPDRNGDVRTKDGKLYATGAYVYKTEISMTSKLRCDLPPFDDETNVNKIGTKKKVKEDLLKSFGYKRPKTK